MFKSGQLTEVLGIPVEDVKPVDNRVAKTAEEQEEFANSLLSSCRREGYDWVELSQILKILDAVRLAYLTRKEAIKAALKELLFPYTNVSAVQRSEDDSDDSEDDSEEENIDTEFLNTLTDVIIGF